MSNQPDWDNEKPEPQGDGLRVNLSGGRSVEVFPAQHDTFMVIFRRGDNETPVWISNEAAAAMIECMYQLRPVTSTWTVDCRAAPQETAGQGDK